MNLNLTGFLAYIHNFRLIPAIFVAFIFLVHGDVFPRENKPLKHTAGEKSIAARAEKNYEAGRYKNALKEYSKLLNWKEKSRNKNIPEIALTHNKIGLIYSELGSYEQALLMFQKAIDLAMTKSDFDVQNLLDFRANMGMALYHLGRYSDALKIQQIVLKSEEKIYGLDHFSVSTSLNNLALTLTAMGRFEEALDLQERDYKLNKNNLGDYHQDTLTSMNNLALIFDYLGRHDASLKLHKSVLEGRLNIFGKYNIRTANSYGNIASIFHNMGMYELALENEKIGYEIKLKILGDKHPSTLIALGGVASFYDLLGKYDLALPLAIRSANGLERLLGEEHPRALESKGNLALIYSNLGQFNKSLLIESKILSIKEKVLGVNHPDTAMAITNLSVTHSDLRQYDKSLSLDLRAVEINKVLYGLNHSKTAKAIGNLAMSYYFLMDYNEALKYQLQSLKIYIEIFDYNHPDVAQAYNNLAAIYIKQGKFDLGLESRVASVAIFLKLYDSMHPLVSKSLHNLAKDYLAIDDLDLALYFFKLSVNGYQNQRLLVSKIGADELNSFTLTVEDTYRSLADLLIGMGRISEAQQVLDMLKEGELFEFTRRDTGSDPRRKRIAFTPAETLLATRYKSVADRLALLGAEQRDLQQKTERGLTAAEKARLAELKADLNVAEQAFTKFLSEMRSNLKAQGPAKVDEVAATSLASQRELQSIIRDLGPDVVLLQYYVTGSKVGVILTTPNVVIPFSTEIDAKVLNRQVFHLKNALRDPRLNVLGPSQSLYQLLLAPVTKALEQTGAKTVMLSLDGQLRHIPFGALHDGNQFAAQRWNFPIYTSVTRERLRAGSTAKWKAAGLGVTKAIGSFDALPAVKAEMDGLLRAAGGQSGQSVVYLDEKFTATRLKEVGQRDFQLMHISSHFSISPGTEVNSFLLLGDGQRLTLGDMRTQNFRFDNVDLLTLSACDTGVGGGRDNTGKEIEGLGVIAQQQGAKAVLATLWPVADGSTAKLMSDMYQRRQSQGFSKIEALRQAQLAMMSQPKYAHPFYWAPFILLGNWQ